MGLAVLLAGYYHTIWGHTPTTVTFLMADIFGDKEGALLENGGIYGLRSGPQFKIPTTLTRAVWLLLFLESYSSVASLMYTSIC